MKAKDQAGNEDPSPANRAFTVSTGGGPEITVTPLTIDFGSVPVGGSSASQTVTVKNDGTAALTIGVVQFEGTDTTQFTKPSDNCSKKTLAPAGSCTLSVRFKPGSIGRKTADVIVLSNDSDESRVPVNLSGTGGGGGGGDLPVIIVNPLALEFGSVPVGDRSVSKTATVKNDGLGNLVIGAVSLSGNNPDQFVKSSDGCSNKTLGPKSSCKLAVRFKPGSTGSKTADLIIPSNDPDDPAVPVSLSGTGEGGGGGDAPDIAVSPANVDFGAVPVGGRSLTDQTVTVRNEGSGTLTITAITFGGANADQFTKPTDNCSKKSLASGASCNVAVRFKPTSGGAKTATLVVPSNDSDENPVNVSLSGTGAP